MNHLHNDRPVPTCSTVFHSKAVQYQPYRWLCNKLLHSGFEGMRGEEGRQGRGWA